MRRQGLEPRTRGLRARIQPCRHSAARVDWCRFRSSAPYCRVALCQLVSVTSAATEHRWSTAIGSRCSVGRRGGGSGATAEAADFRSADRGPYAVWRRDRPPPNGRSGARCICRGRPCTGPNDVRLWPRVGGSSGAASTLSRGAGARCGADSAEPWGCSVSRRTSFGLSCRASASHRIVHRTDRAEETSAYGSASFGVGCDERRG